MKTFIGKSFAFMLVASLFGQFKLSASNEESAGAGSRIKVISRLGDGKLRISWPNQRAVDYVVYRRGNLEVGRWEKAAELAASKDAIRSYDFPIQAIQSSMYYRVVQKPDPFKPFMLLELGGGVQLELVSIPAGTFTMGSPLEEAGRYTDEHPLTEVTIADSFLIGKYEVTQEQWIQIMESNPSAFSDDVLRPVENVSWFDAVNFLLALNELFLDALPMGYAFRLPTEAEWEYSCRAGTTARYSFGDDFNLEQLHIFGNYCDRECATSIDDAGESDGYANTAPAGSFQPNPWGLYDMHGNVWERCSDWYSSDYPGGSVVNPLGPFWGARHVIRGGSYISHARNLRSAVRSKVSPEFSSNGLGFRVVLGVAP